MAETGIPITTPAYDPEKIEFWVNFTYFYYFWGKNMKNL